MAIQVCSKCNNQWEVELRDGQRMILCPSCGSLTPVQRGEGPAAAGYRFGELLSSPVAVSRESSAEEDVIPDSIFGLPSPAEAAGAHLQVDLRNARGLRETLGEMRAREIGAVVKRVVRYESTRFRAREVEVGSHFSYEFDRGADAVAFAVNLQETLAKLSREIGVELEPRIAAQHIHAGEAATIATMMRRSAMPRQILLTSEIFDEAKQAIGTSDVLPRGVQWMRHGRFELRGVEGRVEICEVGRAGFAPLCAPGSAATQGTNPTNAPAAAAPQMPDRSDQTVMTSAGRTLALALQAGKAQLSSSLSRKSHHDAKSADPTAKLRADQLVGKMLGRYRVDGALASDDDTVSYRAYDTDYEVEVELKVLREDAAADVPKLTRFSREGLTASWFRHPNIVAARDMGELNGIHYIAYEMVTGTTLRDLVEKAGTLQPRPALGFALQIARGLEALHARGIIHRDLKPEKVVLSTNGEVKLTSLSLAKIRKESASSVGKELPDSAPILDVAMQDVTMMNFALGAPEYSAPEQARDAARVDHRADQYSLGAVLYFLMTGRPPYSGKNVAEVRTRQVYPYTPIEQIIPGSPKELDALIRKLLDSSVDGRFPSMSKVVFELEFLAGIRSERAVGLESVIPPSLSAGEDSPLRRLEAIHARYHKGFWSLLRAVTTRGFLVLMPLAIVAALALRHFQLAGAVFGLLVMTTFWNLVVGGLLHKDVLFLKLRRAFADLSALGWAITLVLLIGAGAFLYLLGLLLPWLGVSVLGLALALGYQLFVALPLRLHRSDPLNEGIELVRELRSSGLAEMMVQRVVVEACDKYWEEFFEAIFGYDPKIAMRWRLASEGMASGRRRFGAWRDPLHRWSAGFEVARLESRQTDQLAKAELLRLRSQGTDELQALSMAQKEARRLIREQEMERFREKMKERGIKDEIEDVRAEKYGRSRRSRELEEYSPGLEWTRLAANLASVVVGLMAIAGAIVSLAELELPEALAIMAEDYFAGEGLGQGVGGLVVGLLLLSNSTARRWMVSVVILVGALLLLLPAYFVDLVQQSQFDVTTAMISGGMLMVAGFGLTWWGARRRR